MSTKRKLDFHTADEAIAEIQRLRKEGYTKSKNWNLSQICEHLDKTMTGGMEGFGFRLPWILRKTIIPMVFNRMLKNRQMNSAPTIKRLKPTSPGDTDIDETIDACIATFERAASFPGPIEDYPFLDDLSVNDWRQFMYLHAAHHLGFLSPNHSQT
ncbi:MAG: DUF1569 domain-containing protein [Planctomycetota bacterium]